MTRTAAFVAALAIASPSVAHHGGGTFDNTRTIELKGTLTRLELVNPHSWIYFDAAGPDGQMRAYRCEMRSATTLRRSGWKPEMFTPGQRITIEGQPDRKDPNSCYLNTIVLQDGSRTDRYGQFTRAPLAAKREPRRPSGEPNISGDWAPEQLVMTDPRGRGGALVPLSTVTQYKPGEGRIGPLPGQGPRAGGPMIIRGAELTELGTKAATSFGMFEPKDNPRMRCETTSVIFDWTFDGPVNRITQNRDTIVLQYGQFGFTRTVHMNQAAHPASIKPSRAGHSIGRWEKDVLVVDTVGFAPGVLSPPVLNSDKLHVVERFSLDPVKMELTRVVHSRRIRSISRGSTPAPTSSRSPTCRTSRIPARSRRSSTTPRRRPTRMSMNVRHLVLTAALGALCAPAVAQERPAAPRRAAAGGVTRGVDRPADHVARVRAEGRSGAARRQRHPRRAVRRRPADDEECDRHLGGHARARCRPAPIATPSSSTACPRSIRATRPPAKPTSTRGA